MSIQQIWSAFQSIHLNPMLLLDPKSQPSPKLQLHFDNPFLIHYVAYHHYRSLGWVVKGGIKFCVDYLLYKRGPVFSHAECVHSFILPLTVGLSDVHSLDSPSSFAQYTKTKTIKRRPPSSSKILHRSHGHG